MAEEPITMNEQIDGWLAIEFASSDYNIDDHYDRLQFLNDVLENDMVTIGDSWPEFVEFVRRKQEQRKNTPVS